MKIWIFCAKSCIVNNCARLFCKTSVLQKFENFHLRQSPFFNKVVGLRPPSYNFIKKRLRGCFPMNFAKFLRTSTLWNTYRLLLLLRFSNVFMTTNFSFCNYQVINSFKDTHREKVLSNFNAYKK